MSKKAILLIATMLISVAAFAFVYSRRKKDEEINSSNKSGGDLLDLIPDSAGGGPPPNTQQQISNAIKVAAVAAPAIKAIGNVVKDLISAHVGDVVSDQMKNLAENVASDVVKNGGTIAQGAEAAMTKTSEALATKAAEISAGAATTGTTGGTTAAGATTGATLLAVALPLVIIGGIITWAVSMGVFDMTDWKPPYGQVPLTLNAYGASIAGLKEGDIVLVTPGVMAKITTDTSGQYLYSYLEANRHDVEAKAAAIQQIQAINEQTIRPVLDVTSLVWNSNEFNQGYYVYSFNPTDASVTGSWESGWKGTLTNSGIVLTNIYNGYQTLLTNDEYLAELNNPNNLSAQELKQGLAKKAFGNTGTQMNYELSEFEEL